MAYRNKADHAAWNRRKRAVNPEPYRAASRRYYWKNREKCIERSKRVIRRARYGITEDRYQELLREQEGFCAICGKFMEPPSVDHCHVTGEVRGLLCGNCNLMLGNAHDDPAILLRAMFYVNRQL